MNSPRANSATKLARLAERSGAKGLSSRRQSVLTFSTAEWLTQSTGNTTASAWLTRPGSSARLSSTPPSCDVRAPPRCGDESLQLIDQLRPAADVENAEAAEVADARSRRAAACAASSAASSRLRSPASRSASRASASARARAASLAASRFASALGARRLVREASPADRATSTCVGVCAAGAASRRLGAARPRAASASLAKPRAFARRRPRAAPAGARSCRRARPDRPRAGAAARCRAAPPRRPDARACARRRRRPAQARRRRRDGSAAPNRRPLFPHDPAPRARVRCRSALVFGLGETPDRGLVALVQRLLDAACRRPRAARRRARRGRAKRDRSRVARPASPARTKIWRNSGAVRQVPTIEQCRCGDNSQIFARWEAKKAGASDFGVANAANPPDPSDGV